MPYWTLSFQTSIGFVKKNILIRLFQYTAINTRYILIICNHSTVQRFDKMLVLAVKFGKAFHTGGSVIQLIKHLLNPSNFFTKKEEIKEKTCFQFHLKQKRSIQCLLFTLFSHQITPWVLLTCTYFGKVLRSYAPGGDLIQLLIKYL